MKNKTLWNSVYSVVRKVKKNPYHLRAIHQSKIINQNPIMKKEIWQKILQFVITVLTALATSIGVTSCGV